MPLPPGPTLPRAIQTLMLATRPFELLDGCARRYGSPFTLRVLGMGEWVIPFRPDQVKSMYTADPDAARAGEINRRTFSVILGEHALFLLDGEAHVSRRRLLMRAFVGDEMRRYTRTMREIAESELRSWPEHEPFALLRCMQRVSAQVILRVVFGLNMQEERGRRLGELLLRVSDVASSSPLLLIPALQIDLGPRSPWGRIVALMKETDAALYEELRIRRRLPLSEQPRDVLTMLLRITGDEGQPLSDRELRDELVLLLLGGYENTAMALAWTFEQMLSAPDVLARAREEVLAVLGPEGPVEDRVERLEYLDAVIKEALRARPPLYIAGGRLLRESVQVGRYAVPAGATLVNCPYLLHRQPEVYPEPERFLPERFLGRKLDPYEWTPFGGGPRRCLGLFFTIHEMKVVIATVLAQARLRLATPRREVRRRGFQIAPADGVRVVLDRGA